MLEVFLIDLMSLLSKSKNRRRLNEQSRVMNPINVYNSRISQYLEVTAGDSTIGWVR
jgi:hypothetical protein